MILGLAGNLFYVHNSGCNHESLVGNSIGRRGKKIEGRVPT